MGGGHLEPKVTHYKPGAHVDSLTDSILGLLKTMLPLSLIY